MIDMEVTEKETIDKQTHYQLSTTQQIIISYGGCWRHFSLKFIETEENEEFEESKKPEKKKIKMPKGLR